MTKTMLITGSGGQIGSDLVDVFVSQGHNIIATDISKTNYHDASNKILDVLQKKHLQDIVKQEQVTEIYHLAALLSARGEQDPQKAWAINMQGLLNVLDVAREYQCKVFWPSSIAVFGQSTPKHLTPQSCILDPSTVYGISKLAGEMWCEYYCKQYQVDVRSLRFPGIISWKGNPGGGTTDYAVDIFHHAVQHKPYVCFLSEDTYLPMLYIEDAIQGILSLMTVDSSQLTCRTSYNISGVSFSPKELSTLLQAKFPGFEVTFEPDFRQTIANSWPASIDDMVARKDWNWSPVYDLSKMANEMILRLTNVYNQKLMY